MKKTALLFFERSLNAVLVFGLVALVVSFTVSLAGNVALESLKRQRQVGSTLTSPTPQRQDRAIQSAAPNDQDVAFAFEDARRRTLEATTDSTGWKGRANLASWVGLLLSGVGAVGAAFMGFNGEAEPEPGEERKPRSTKTLVRAIAIITALSTMIGGIGTKATSIADDRLKAAVEIRSAMETAYDKLGDAKTPLAVRRVLDALELAGRG